MRKAGIFLSLAAACLIAGSGGAALAQGFGSSVGYKFLDAVKKKDGDTVEKMLSSSGSKTTSGDIVINTRDNTSGDSALHLVIGLRDQKWLEYLIYKGADVNIRNFKGTTPLWLAISTNFIDGASVLIAKRARVNDPGPAGETPLIAAVHLKNLELIKTLITAGADPTRADNSGRNALDYSKLGGTSMMTSELETATKATKAKKANAYGPSF